MRSLSLRSGNSPTTPYGGRVNGLQSIGFPPPCHPNYRALALTPAGLSPAERASLCWTHVGSRTGAPTVGSGGNPTTFALVRSPAPIITFPAPASSNAACGFPALRFSCLLHVKGYAAYSAFAFTYIFPPQVVQFDRRLSHLASASHVVKVVTDSRAASSTGVTRLHRVLPAPPPPSRLSADFRCCRFTAYLCSADFSTGRGGLLQLLSASSSPYRRYHPAGVP